MPTEPPAEHPSAYFVQDRESQEEMTRIEIQDKILTKGQGGPLPELTDHSHLQSILDVGCGTGGWLMETARTYPMIQRLVGVDISGKRLEYARACAEAEQLHHRVQFQTMDALRVLEFPEASFDLVNQRLGASWLRIQEWRKILVEYRRVVRPGGIIRITEMDGLVENTSSALTQLGQISLETFYHSGRLFTPEHDGLTGQLVRLLTEHDIENIKTHVHTIILRAGTPEGQHFYEDIALGYRVALPFFHKWTSVPTNYEEIYQQALKDMQQPDFAATWKLLTVWGTKPEDGKSTLTEGLN